MSNPLSSQAVSFWSVHLWVERWREAAGITPGDFPMLGTPPWCDLAEDDPRVMLAVLDGGQHQALRLELNQEARAEASKAVAGAADWPAVAREIQQRNDIHTSKPWLKRVVS